MRLLALGLLTLLAQAPTPTTTPAAVLDKYVQAVGGRAAIEKITTGTAKGTIEIADFGIGGTVQLWQKAPGMTVTIAEIDQVGTTREGFDGTVAWDQNPQSGLREKTGLELAEAKLSAVFPRELKLQALYPKMTMKPNAPVDGRDCVVIEATPTEGAPTTWYFDAQSGLLVRQITTRPTAQGPTTVDAYFSDIKPVDGVMRAHMIRQVTPQYTIVIKLSEIKHNVAIDDAVFRKPGR